MTYEKEAPFHIKIKNFFREEFFLNEEDSAEIVKIQHELEQNHTSMDEPTFKAKMNRFYELACGGCLKKAMVDGLNEYLGIEK